MVHPATLKAFDLDGPVAAVELYLDAVPGKRSASFMRPAYAPPALQAVTRDFAFTVAADLSADTLVRATKGADKDRKSGVEGTGGVVREDRGGGRGSKKKNKKE